MKIQSTGIPVSPRVNFGQKRPTTWLPGELRVKSNGKRKMKSFIPLIPISLLFIATMAWRSTPEYEAQQKSKKFQKIFAEYQHEYNKIRLDSTSSHQDSVIGTQKRDSLTIDFLKKLAELSPPQREDTPYIDLTKRYQHVDDKN